MIVMRLLTYSTAQAGEGQRYSAILERRLLASLWLGEVSRPLPSFSLSWDLQPK